MGVTHSKVSAKSDGADSTLVLPSDWNAAHTVTGLADDPHGAAQHTDITRSFFVPAQGQMQGSGTATVGTAPDGLFVHAYADGSSVDNNFAILIPEDAKAAQPLNAIIFWAPGSTDGTAHTVRWSFDLLVIAAGTTISGAGTTTTFTGSSAARTANVAVVEAAQQVLASVSAGDMIRVNLRRIGADAADTYVGQVNLLGIKFSYSAVQ